LGSRQDDVKEVVEGVEAREDIAAKERRLRGIVFE
jgi:hypothetical protein